MAGNDLDGGVGSAQWDFINPLDPTFRANPHSALKRLRAEEPVSRAREGFWRLCRYEDCVRLLTRVDTGVRAPDGTFPGEAILPGGRAEFLLQQDAPNHTRLRRLMIKGFTPRAIDRLRQKLTEFIDGLVDNLVMRGEMDVITDLALPVPSFAICELLGVPFRDNALFADWTADATHLLASALAPVEVIERGQLALGQLQEYFARLIVERRENLGDDVLSALIRAEDAGDKLEVSELLAQCRGLLIAGFETTIGLIGNGMLALLNNPAEFRRLGQNPDLIGSAIEECLRFDGPIILTPRYLREDAVFAGELIPQGAQVWAMLLAANRDPERFPNADQFDIARMDNQHIAFGGGAHFCLGAHLARMEAALTIEAIVRRFQGLALVSDGLEWGRSLFRVLRRLPVRFEGVRS